MHFTKLQLHIIESGLKKGLSKDKILKQLMVQQETAKLAISQQDEVFLRRVFKKSVMTVSSYDARLTSVRANTVEELTNSTFIRKSNKEIISRLSQDIFNTIQTTLGAASAYKEYAKKGLATTLKKTSSIDYICPINKFPVHLRIPKQEKVQIRYRISGTRRTYMACLIKTLPETDNKKTVSSSVPSIIHSIDAAIMMRTKERFSGEMATIHDSFGCHLDNVDALRYTINHTLQEVNNTDVLKNIFTQLGYDIPPPDFGDEFDVTGAQYAFN